MKKIQSTMIYIFLLILQFLISFIFQAILIVILSAALIIASRMIFENLDLFEIIILLVTFIITGLFTVSTYKILRRKIDIKWKFIGLLLVHSVATGLVILQIIYVLFFFSLFEAQHKTYKKPKDCNLETLSEIEECKGYAILGFQSNYDYDIRAYGNANKELCQKYKKSDFSNSLIPPMNTTENVEAGFSTYENHNCNINEPEKSWQPVKCNFSEYPQITNCYACAKGLGNGNGHRFALLAYSDNCETGAYVFLAQWRTILIEKVRTLIPLDDRTNPPEIYIENTNKKSRGIF